LGGISREPGQRRENLSGRTSVGAKCLRGHRRISGNLILPSAVFATEASFISYINLDRIVLRQIADGKSRPSGHFFPSHDNLIPASPQILWCSCSAALPRRPRTRARVALCRARSLAVMVCEVRGCGRNHVNQKRRGRVQRDINIQHNVAAPSGPSSMLRRRKYNKARAGRDDERQISKLRLPARTRGNAPATAPPMASSQDKNIIELNLRTYRDPPRSPPPFQINFAFSRTTTKARTDTESPLNVRRARREYTEDAPAEPIGRSIWKTPCRLL